MARVLLANKEIRDVYLVIYIYRMSQEECARIREGVPYAKLYRYNPKHLSPKWNGYGDNGQRKVWFSCGSTHCTCRLTLSPPSSLNVVPHDKLSAGRWAVNFTAYKMRALRALHIRSRF